MQFRLLRISGHSMEPTIKNGSVVVISNILFMFKTPKEKDIIAFKNKDKVFIKRISKINNGKYFLEGDNKNDSLDSRKIGLIEGKDIIGKVILKF